MLQAQAFLGRVAEMVQWMAAWMASRAVLQAPVAVRLVRALAALELAMAGQMATPAEDDGRLRLTGGLAAMAVWRWLSLNLVGGRGGSHYPLPHPAGVRPRFFAFSFS